MTHIHTLGPVGDDGEMGDMGGIQGGGRGGRIRRQSGVKGEIGDKGDTGDAGPKGEMGDSGEPGIIGLTGRSGFEGDKGEKGLKGLDGFPGIPGDIGSNGSKGDIGEKGNQGPVGPGGFARRGMYIRWGRYSCPFGNGTETLYSGRAGGSDRATDYMCFPQDPEYSVDNIPGYYYAHGVEFKKYPTELLYRNVPCAVCYIPTRPTVMMIPAQLTCPANWIMEYTGYLMTSNYYRSKHECVDSNPDFFQKGSTSDNIDPLGFFPIRVSCDSDLPCPPYSTTDEAVTCVVCSY